MKTQIMFETENLVTRVPEKRIAFSWTYPLEPPNGGVERVTQRLMSELSTRGFECLFLLHDVQSNRVFCDGQDVGDLATFLTRRNVRAIVNQNGYSSQLTELLGAAGWGGNYVVCHHNEPRYLQKLYDWRRVLYELFVSGRGFNNRLSWCGRLAGYPIWRVWSNRRIGRVQALNYRRCGRYVLLSPKFLSEFRKVIRRTSVAKAIAIPNPLSFSLSPAEAKRFVKEKEVLIVARMHDAEKRISAALKAWALVERRDRDDWILKIVGDGPDFKRLMGLARRLRLKRVVFLGRQDPLTHYQSASIFLMTSRVEGWGLTLTEAMQTGTVPIAFDAYASLHDIIERGRTGVVVGNGDIKALASETLRLMSDATRRQALAANAIAACQTYRIEAVADQWEAIL